MVSMGIPTPEELGKLFATLEAVSEECKKLPAPEIIDQMTESLGKLLEALDEVGEAAKLLPRISDLEEIEERLERIAKLQQE